MNEIVEAMSRTIAEKYDYENLDWYREFLLSLRYSLDLRAYPSFANIVAGALNGAQKFRPVAAPDEDQAKLNAWGRTISDDGYVELGTLATPEMIEDIHRYLDDKKTNYAWDKSLGYFNPKEAPPQVSVANYDRDVIVAAPHLHLLANHPRVLSVAMRYLGVMPSLMGLNMWWSIPGRAQAEHAQLFHIDRHCYRFCKLFVYLTDVDDESGPHVYVRGTGDRNRVNKIAEEKAAGDPEKLKHYMEIIGKQRKTDAEIEEVFGAEQVVTKTGVAGNAMLGNTGSIHKGMLPKSKPRLLFQALYTMLPTIKDPVVRPECPNLIEDIHRLYPGAYTDDQIAYINRLVAKL